MNSPQYKIPSHLIQMAQEENLKLQQMRYRNTYIYYILLLLNLQLFITVCLNLCLTPWFRCSEEFEAANNTVELHLHLAPRYRLKNGGLQPASKEPNGVTTLSFDRRKTVGDLRITIYQVIPKMPNVILKSHVILFTIDIIILHVLRCRNSGREIWL